MPSFILTHPTVLATVQQCHRHDRTGQDMTDKWSDSIRQTVLQALVTQKFTYSTIYGPVIKVISCKAILLPQTEGFNGIRQAAQMYTPYSISQLASTLYQCCPLVSCFQCTECQTCPGMFWLATFHSRNCLFTRGDVDPIKHMVSWAHSSPHPKWHLDRFSHFLHTQGMSCRQTDRPDRSYV